MLICQQSDEWMKSFAKLEGTAVKNVTRRGQLITVNSMNYLPMAKSHGLNASAQAIAIASLLSANTAALNNSIRV